MEKKKRARISKARVINICNRINNGVSPARAVAMEGLGGPYLIALKKSGIIFTDNDGNWVAKSRIHDQRYDDFIKYKVEYTQAADARGREKKKGIVTVTENKQTKRVKVTPVKVTFWQKVVNFFR